MGVQDSDELKRRVREQAEDVREGKKARISSEDDFELLTAWFCPFAQRAEIALNEKGVKWTPNRVMHFNKESGDFEKEDKLLKFNPFAKAVPVALHNDDVFVESMIISHYIDESFGRPHQLQGVDPKRRAHTRMAIDRLSKTVVDTFYRTLMAKDEESKEKHFASFTEGVQWFSENATGPFFYGDEFSSVDLAVAPFIACRLLVLEQICNVNLPKDKNFEKFWEWKDAVMNRESIRKTLITGFDDEIVELYRKYTAVRTEIPK